MQDEEIPDELEVHVSKLPKLVLGSKAKNTYKNYMYNFKQFSKCVKNMVTNSVPAAKSACGYIFVIFNGFFIHQFQKSIWQFTVYLGRMK